MVLRISFLILSALVPALLLVYFFYKRDVNSEPRSILIKTFFLGMAITIPVLMVGLPIAFVSPSFDQPFVYGMFVAFIGAAIPEECFKFLVLVKYSVRRPAFDEPMDGIVYGATASLGFAALENILYVTTSGWGTAILRALTAVPAHACFGAVMGYYVGQAKMGRLSDGYKWLGLIFAILLHGLYDLPLFVQEATAANLEPGDSSSIFVILTSLFLAILIGSIIWTLVLVSRARKVQLLEESKE